jgi:hypothetical protein
MTGPSSVVGADVVADPELGVSSFRGRGIGCVLACMCRGQRRRPMQRWRELTERSSGRSPAVSKGPFPGPRQATPGPAGPIRRNPRPDPGPPPSEARSASPLPCRGSPAPPSVGPPANTNVTATLPSAVNRSASPARSRCSTTSRNAPRRRRRHPSEDGRRTGSSPRPPQNPSPPRGWSAAAMSCPAPAHPRVPATGNVAEVVATHRVRNQRRPPRGRQLSPAETCAPLPPDPAAQRIAPITASLSFA